MSKLLVLGKPRQLVRVCKLLLLAMLLDLLFKCAAFLHSYRLDQVIERSELQALILVF